MGRTVKTGSLLARPRLLSRLTFSAAVLLGLLDRGSAAEPDRPPAPLRDASLAVQLIRDPAVQSELQLDPEQVKAVEALVGQVEYPLFLIRDLPFDKKRDRSNQISDQVDQTLRQELTPSQRTRMAQIIFQAQGLPALVSPDRAAALKITDAQQAELTKEIALLQKVEQDKLAEQRQRILGILTPAQRGDLSRMAGKEFDVAAVKQVACRAPELRDVQQWINTPPLKLERLKGRVVALHFWALGCINCVRNLPHYQAWHERYADQGLTVLGLHTPETAQERDAANLERAVKERKIAYPVAFDAKSANWNAWANHLWPSVYLIDRQGYVRYWWYGELNWEGARGEELSRKRIEELLAEAP